MASNKRDIDMLHGTLWDKIFIFALPLAFTGVMQQLFNTADVVVLGRFVSSEAMAAVGNNVPVIGLIVSLFMGLALGANVVVARLIGMGRPEEANTAVHTALTQAVKYGLATLALGEALAGPFTSLLGVPASVAAYSETYLRVLLLGLPFVAVYNFLAAIYRSTGDTRTPLYALIAGSLFNIAGNLFFVLALGLDVGGVALATVLANLLAASILYVKLTKAEGPLRIERRKLFSSDRRSARAIFRIGMPAAVQSMVFSLSNLVIQSAINSLGPDAMAGSVAGFTIEINIYCFINAFGLSATTFVSQNYGAGNLERCRRATWVSMLLNFAVTFLLIGVVLAAGRELLSLFTTSEAVIALGFVRILYVVTLEPVNVIMETVSDAMRGYGYSLPPAVITLVLICSIRVIWVYTAFAASPTFETLMTVYPISWIATTVALCALYWHHQKKILPRKAAL